jgi:hypothetical protein
MAAAKNSLQSAGAGYVYLAQSGERFKIGRTLSLERRISGLAGQLPEKIVLLHAIKTEDTSGIEAYWHRRFADQRLNGEWFALEPDDIEIFKGRSVM